MMCGIDESGVESIVESIVFASVDIWPNMRIF